MKQILAGRTLTYHLVSGIFYTNFGRVCLLLMMMISNFEYFYQNFLSKIYSCIPVFTFINFMHILDEMEISKEVPSERCIEGFCLSKDNRSKRGIKTVLFLFFFG